MVAQRLAFAEDEALTLGRAVAGLNAQSKGRRLGIFKPHEEKEKKEREKGPCDDLSCCICLSYMATMNWLPDRITW
jgi:hypothetical protein